MLHRKPISTIDFNKTIQVHKYNNLRLCRSTRTFMFSVGLKVWLIYPQFDGIKQLMFCPSHCIPGGEEGALPSHATTKKPVLWACPRCSLFEKKQFNVHSLLNFCAVYWKIIGTVPSLAQKLRLKKPTKLSKPTKSSKHTSPEQGYALLVLLCNNSDIKYPSSSQESLPRCHWIRC